MFSEHFKLIESSPQLNLVQSYRTRVPQTSMYSINMFGCDYIMSFTTTIPSVTNTLKKIYIGGNMLDEFTSTYYDDKNDTFVLLFQQYTSSTVEK